MNEIRHMVASETSHLERLLDARVRLCREFHVLHLRLERFPQSCSIIDG